MVLFFLCLAYGDIIENPGFETWSDSSGVVTPVGWITSEPAFRGSAIKTTDAHAGSLGLELNKVFTLAFAMIEARVHAESTYYFSAWAKSSALGGGVFVIQWLDTLQEPLSPTPTLIFVLPSVAYQEYTKELLAPDSAAFVHVNICYSDSTTALLVDDVTIVGPKVGIEEKDGKSHVAGHELRVRPNPFAFATRLKLDNPRGARLYDIRGCLLGELRDGVFGENLGPGLYFVRAEGSRPLKLVKLR